MSDLDLIELGLEVPDNNGLDEYQYDSLEEYEYESV